MNRGYLHSRQPAAEATEHAGWVEHTYRIGRLEKRWFERPKPGCPGTFERVYDVPMELGKHRGVRDRISPVVEVLLRKAARELMLSAAMWQSGVDGLETGGWLIGGGLDAEVVVTHATRPGPTAVRSSSSFVDDLCRMSRFNLQRLWGDPLSSRVGSWHTHPSGSAEPSEGDISSWRAGLEVVNRESWQPYYIGMIAAPSSDRRWQLHTWTTRFSDGGEIIFERAELRALEVSL
jgi:integrative and conjugative element protein (TIGR02256 family)